METKNNASEMLKMNIQLLASDEGQNTDSGDVNVDNVQDNTNENQDNVQTEKTFTQEDIDKIIAKKLKQWEKKTEERTKQIEEAEKLKAMSESERQQAEMKKQLEEFNKMKAEIAREKLSGQVVKELASRELPIEYAEYVMVEGDAEATMERLTTFAEKYKADVQAEVDRQVQGRLRSNAPKGMISSGTSNTSFTVEDIKKMSPAEINQNWDKIKHIKLG